MGIRGLLSILRRGLGASMLRLIPPKNRGFVVSHMYIDVIQFVHKALNLIKAEALQENTNRLPDDDEVCERTAALVISFIRDISPREFLGIYFDGIPPLAKVIEQRARRYEMGFSPREFNKSKITVGTAFLRNVVEKLLSKLAENPSLLPPHVEVSTPSEQGEGEHKIANRIRDRDATHSGMKVIVADDGDVMIMSLLNSWKNCYIYLDHTDPKPQHGLLSIGAIAERIRYRLGDTPTAIFDFCLMVILTGGNDFMPTILSARDRPNILTQLMDMYAPILKGQPLMINQGRQIVWASVRMLINELSTTEEIRLRELSDLIKKRTGRMAPLFTRSMDPKTGEIKMMFFRRAWDDEIYEPRVDKASMPENVTVPYPSQREIDNDHAFSASQYLQGLAWTLGYMRTGDGPDWYYSAAYPPLFGDIARIMASSSAVAADPTRVLQTLPPWEPLPLAVYLLTVLPRWAAIELFGDTLANAFSLSTGIGDLFPKSFSYFSPAEWDVTTRKGRAILPPLAIDRITKVVKENDLDIDVIERNFRALEPRLRFSRTQGEWISSSSAGAVSTDDKSKAGASTVAILRSSSSRQQQAGGEVGCLGYEILDAAIRM